MAGAGPTMTRRGFFRDAARGAAVSGLCGAGFLGLVQQSRALAPQALRPPGALNEADFLAACLRCGLCVRACPYDILKLADLGREAANGTPYFVARKTPCEMCDDIPCVKACPSGALDHALQKIDDARMGVAVITSRETCLNLQGLRCDVCHRVCPLSGKAITLEDRHNARTGKHAIFEPVVHADSCTGCGKCEKACVLEEAAIKVLPLRLANGQIAAHYRLGWEEKNKLGHELVPGIGGLPARRPEGAP